MNHVTPLTTFRVEDTDVIVLTRAQFELIMNALDDRLDSRVAERALAELEGHENDLLTAKETKERAKAPLRFWRKRRGLTQAALAEQAEVSQAYVAEIEAGKKDGGIRAMQRIAKALDVTLDDLVA